MWSIPNYEERKKNLEEALRNANDTDKNKKTYEIMLKYYSEDEKTHNEGCSEFIESIRYYIYQIIHQKYSGYVHDYFSDLYSEGVIGVLADLPNYDPTKSAPTTYFDIRIKHQINIYISTQINKISSHYISNMAKINRAITELKQKGINATNQDIAIATGLSVETVMQTIRINESVNTMQSCDSNDFEVENQLISKELSPEAAYLKNESITELKEAINRLPELDRAIIQMKYGIDTFIRPSYKEISDELTATLGRQIPVNKVRSSYQQSVKKLRKMLASTGRYTDNVKKKRESILDSVEINLVKPEISEKALEEISKDYLELVNPE